VSTTFGLPSRSGPNTALSHHLDHRHAGQTTKEFLLHYGLLDDSIAVQLNRLRSELEAGRLASLMVKNGFTEGHVITAHDMETLSDGSTVIYTYDNEREFVPEEETDTTGVTHRDREAGSQVVVNAATTRWDYSGRHTAATTARCTSARRRTGPPVLRRRCPASSTRSSASSAPSPASARPRA
jgi:hypothetical protein